ncbi:M6 family metalloprotease domain-containing protein [Carboxylicivirga sp. N1Y90]|uniref:M6 family metalloprotease domain-containing protein n=1 Tax=Carboxylicivirga fragile TaxID=3417571 RepID=UPI003D3318B4|nr:M6 family metalloprotease domain-containing protein [Marinilabiliaceae bacterium N1Y90]
MNKFLRNNFIIMEKSKFLLAKFWLLVALVLVSVSSLAGPIKRQLTLEQPDGTKIEAILQGDEFFASVTSLDGYTIEQNEEGWWTIATLDAKGNLTASDQVYGEVNLKSGTVKNLKPSKAVMQTVIERRTKFNEQLKQKFKRAEQSLKATNADYSGVWEVPVVRVDFADFAGTKTIADFDKFFHDMEDTQMGSFNQYYYENSQGTFTIKATIFDWVTDQNNVAYYANSNSDSQSRVKDMTRRAINYIEANENVDWSLFDNQNSGKVDMVMVIHAGEGAAWGDNNEYIWAHMWWGLGLTHDGVEFDVYNVQPELQDGNIATIGLYAHEFGHALGLPDLYDYSGASAGIGGWGMMAGGSWGGSGYCPTHFCAWSKVKLGWATAVELNGANGLISVDKYHNYGGATTNNVFRYSTDDPNEYFLVSNRRQDAYDWYVPGEGLVVEHVNELGDNSYRDDPLVQIVEADGNWDLYSNGYGSASDPFPGSNNITVLTDATTPSTNLRDGSPSGFAMLNITQLADDFNVTFNLSADPNDPPIILGASGNGKTGESIQITADFMGDVNSYSWKFYGADISSSSLETPTVVYENPGVYAVELSLTNNNGTSTQVIEACVVVEYGTGLCAAEALEGTGGDNIVWVQIGDFSHENEWSAYSSYLSSAIELPVGDDFGVAFDIANLYDGDMPFGWVDWNRNDVFEDNEQIIFPAYTEYNTDYGYIGTNTTVTPPSGAEGYYVLRIRNQYGNSTPVACGSDVYGEVEDYLINLISTTSVDLGHCQGQSADNLGGDYIDNVMINGLSYNSGSSLYSDFKYKDISIVSNELSITVEIANAYDDIICGWIDWDNSTSFDENERIEFDLVSSTKGRATIDIPTGTSGEFVLRVRNQWSEKTPTPCGSDVTGEVEDYLLNVTYVATSSPVIEKDGVELKLYPNPTTNLLNVELSVGQTTEFIITVVDITGRTVNTLKRDVHSGSSPIQLDFSEYAKGMYFVKVANEQFSTVKSVIKK